MIIGQFCKQNKTLSLNTHLVLCWSDKVFYQNLWNSIWFQSYSSTETKFKTRFLKLKNSFDSHSIVFCVQIYTRFRVGVLQQYFKCTICLVFYEIQNKVWHDRGQLKFQLRPNHANYVKKQLRLSQIHVPNAFVNTWGLESFKTRGDRTPRHPVQ